MKLPISKYLHKLFELGVIIKCIDGAWETISGFLFLFLKKATMNIWFFSATRNELLEDPHDRLINLLAHSLQNFSRDTQIFAAIYILLHGFLNIFLAIQLYRRKYWAYLAAIIVMLIFMAYQIYRISVHHSLVLTVITIFDAFFIALTWYEYKSRKNFLENK